MSRFSADAARAMFRRVFKPKPEAHVCWGCYVLETAPGSPAEESGLIPFLDVIVTADGDPFDGEGRTLGPVARAYDGKELPLVVYNIKTCSTRIARFDYYYPLQPLTPDGPPIQDRIVVVRSVREGSEADLCGLRGGEDFVLGCGTMLITNCEELIAYLQQQPGAEAAVFVYNAPTDTVRPVVLKAPGEKEAVRAARAPGGPPSSQHVFLMGAELMSGPRSAGSVPAGAAAPPSFEFPLDARRTLGRAIDPRRPEDAALLTPSWQERMARYGTLLERTLQSTAAGAGEAASGGGAVGGAPGE